MSAGRIIAFIFLLFLCVPCSGQSLQLRTNPMLGAIIRHKEELQFVQERPSLGLSVAGELDASGLFPRIEHAGEHLLGLELSYYNYGVEKYGSVVALLPYINFHLLSNQRHRLGFHLGSGIAYHNKYYHGIHNPENKAIGSRINNVTKLGLTWRLRVREGAFLSAGTALYHNSNGAKATPNQGLNTLFFSLAFQREMWHGNPRATHRFIQFPKHLGEVGLVYTTRQGSILGGPDYRHYEINAGILFHTGSSNYLGGGLVLSGDEEEVEWLLYNDVSRSRKEARRLSRALAVYVSDEILLGNFGLNFTFGSYLKSYQRPRLIFQKLHFRYHIGDLCTPIRGFVGVELKAHHFVAEYIGLKYGVGF